MKISVPKHARDRDEGMLILDVEVHKSRERLALWRYGIGVGVSFQPSWFRFHSLIVTKACRVLLQSAWLEGESAIDRPNSCRILVAFSSDIPSSVRSYRECQSWNRLAALV